MSSALTRSADRSRPYTAVDPLRPLDWRFQRVLRLCDRLPTPGRCTPRDDEYVRRARAFLLRYRAADEDRRAELQYDDPDLYAALTLYLSKSDPLSGGDQALTLEARILSGQSDEEISAHYPFGPRAVDYYEALFFHVRDRLGKRDWITTQVLLPALRRDARDGLSPAGEPHAGGHLSPVTPLVRVTPDGGLKFFAYFAGPHVLEHLLTGFVGGPRTVSPEEIADGSWYVKHYASTIKRRAAQAATVFEINRYNVIEVFSLVNQLLSLEKSDASGGDNRTRVAYENHIKSCLDSLPWTVGQRDDRFAFDRTAAEARDDEILRSAAGERVDTLEGLELLRIPEPAETTTPTRTTNVLE